MTSRRLFAVLLAVAVAATVARAGHELPVYPSYYPHEIEIETMPPERAGGLLPDGKIHAYVGAPPRWAVPPPESVSSIEALGAFVLVRVNPLRATGDTPPACAIARGAIGAVTGGGFVVHPYPVTPLHGDYLRHADLAAAARDAWAANPKDASPQRSLRIRPSGAFAKALVPAALQTQAADWDAEVLVVDAAALSAGAMRPLNGWLGDHWARTGWHHAYRLLGSALDGEAGEQVETLRRRLQSGDFADEVERVNAERDIVAALTGHCRVAVAGYTMKRAFFNSGFSSGVENIGFDWLDGFNSPMFIRTVKLKDFPWNGWLALGVDGGSAAAWNPVAGFTDPFGRLMWSAVSDPALLPAPYDTEWMLNRVSDVQSSQSEGSR
jgi:hypothetical protein